jgi:hypothetical protein
MKLGAELNLRVPQDSGQTKAHAKSLLLVGILTFQAM